MSKSKSVTFTPAEDFVGYPDGKTKMEFKAGVRSDPVAQPYAELMREKGLVQAGTHITPVDPEPKEDKTEKDSK